MGPLILESPAFPSGDASYLSMGVLFHFPLIGSFSVFLSESPTSLYFRFFFWKKIKTTQTLLIFSFFGLSTTVRPLWGLPCLACNVEGQGWRGLITQYLGSRHLAGSEQLYPSSQLCQSCCLLLGLSASFPCTEPG